MPEPDIGYHLALSPVSVVYSTFEIPVPFSSFTFSSLILMNDVLYQVLASVPVPTSFPVDVIDGVPQVGATVSTITVRVSCFSLPEISFAMIVNSLVPSAT